MAVGLGLTGVRRGSALLLATGLLLHVSSALGIVVAPSSCFNDTDCPDQACGGDVCNWALISPYGTPDRPYTCNPAGTDPKGRDGWCTSDENCKCYAQGARCLAPYCTFTHPGDAPGGGAPAHAGSSSSAGMPASGGSSKAGSSTGGTRSAPVPPEPMGRDDTTEHTAQACSVGRAPSCEGIWTSLALICGFGAAFVSRRGALRRIPT